MKHIRSFLLAPALSLVLSMTSPAQPLDRAQADRFSRIRMDGAPVSQDFKLPLSLLQTYEQPGALVTKDGIILRYRDGILSARWEVVDMLEVEQGLLTLSLGKTLYRDVPVHLVKPEDGNPNQPYLQNPKAFLKAVLGAGGFVRAPDRPGGEVYIREGQPEKPVEPRFFPYTGNSTWRLGFSAQELASLPAECGLTVNEAGMALVEPFGVQSIRWDEADQLSTPFDERQYADVEVYDLDSASGLNVHFPYELYLRPEDIWRLGRTLQANFSDGHFRPLKEHTFYPLYTTCPEWVADSKGAVDETRAAILAPSAKLWPFHVKEAGLYVLPEGICEIRNYTVIRMPYASVEQVYGEVDGGFEVFPSAVAVEPILLGDGPAYRQLRRDLVKVMDLKGDGGSGTFFKAEEESQPSAVSEPHYYRLSSKMGWKGLPLYTLGPSPWPNGLYLLPEGIVSISDFWIGLAPWSEVRSLTVTEDEEEGGSIFESVQGDAVTYISFPPTRYEEAPRLALSAEEARKAIERYVTLDEQGVPHPRPPAEMPTEKTRLEWRANPTAAD